MDSGLQEKFILSETLRTCKIKYLFVFVLATHPNTIKLDLLIFAATGNSRQLENH